MNIFFPYRYLKIAIEAMASEKKCFVPTAGEKYGITMDYLPCSNMVRAQKTPNLLR